MKRKIKSKTEISVFDVADYIIQKWPRTRKPLSSVKLHQLLYYSQAWHLVWDKKPLFKEAIFAWANNPIIKELYKQQKGLFELKSIQDGDIKKLSSEQKKIVGKIIQSYGRKESQWLKDLIHLEDPWKKARKGLRPFERGNQKISIDEMYKYYSKASKEGAPISNRTKTSISEIADYFLWFANCHNDLVTNLQIQKLCYLTEGYYLGLYGTELTEEQFQAWKHGPVSPTLWERFKKYAFNPINEELPRLNPKEEDPFEFRYKKPKISREAEYILKLIIKNFWGETAWELECLTLGHLPWQEARKGKKPIEHCTRAIDKQSMKNFYRLFLNAEGTLDIVEQ